MSDWGKRYAQLTDFDRSVPKTSLCQKHEVCSDPISADPIRPFPRTVAFPKSSSRRARLSSGVWYNHISVCVYIYIYICMLLYGNYYIYYLYYCYIMLILWTLLLLYCILHIVYCILLSLSLSLSLLSLLFICRFARCGDGAPRSRVRPSPSYYYSIHTLCYIML